MIQIFILGSSSVYGVGAKDGGWADIIKREIHAQMFGENGVGEKYEIYNFGKSGATIDFVKETFPQQLKQYGRGGKTITIVSVGGNNTKAENQPHNYVSTIEDYSKQMTNLIEILKQKSDHVIAIGSGFYDESKTNPKPNPLTGGKSYFTNKRRADFQEKFRKICGQKNVDFIEVGVSEKEWKQKYLFNDGLHPNQAGHQLIAKKTLKSLKKII